MKSKVPVHIAIIMDGNGRWAKKRGLPRTAGHKKGIERIEEIVDKSRILGVKILTLFAFSTENWNRPKDEVEMLFSYLEDFLKREGERIIDEGVRINFVGRRDRIKKDLLKEMERIEVTSKDKDSFILNIALDYGGRWDITYAAKRLVCAVVEGEVKISDIDENIFSRYLCLSDQPPPDLLIRTAGEQRISNFLLWQTAYTEFYFPDIYWPDFNGEELEKAIAEYARRERRFGKIEE